MKTKEAIAQILKQEGVEFLSCFPSNPMIDACAELGIRPVIARTERGVVNIADGYSRQAGGGRIGVCAMQEGAGIENAFAGVAQAYADSIPLLVLPAYWGHDMVSVPPHFDAVSNFHHVTKWAAQVNSPDRVPEMLRRAFTLMRTGRPGPVLLEVPKDVADQELTQDLRYAPVHGRRTGPDPDDVDKAIELLGRAQRPVLMAGRGVHQSEAWAELRRFAEVAGLPVVTTMNGKSSFPESHPLALGVAGLTTTGMAREFLAKTDFVLSVGASLTKWWMFPQLPEGCTIVQCTIDERDLNKDHAIEHAVVGDAKLTLRALADAMEECVGSVGDGTVEKEIAATKRAWLDGWMPKLTSDEVPINPYRVVWEIANTVDRENTVLTHDSGNPRDQLAPFYEAVAPLGYVGWGHSTQLGFSVGLSIGMKLARPDRTVINVLGDAGIGMAGMDLETAVRARAGTVTIVFNNGLMGNYETFIPIAAERYRGKELGGNYVKVAEGLGAWAERVERPDAISGAIARATEVARDGQPALIEVMTREESAFSNYE